MKTVLSRGTIRGGNEDARLLLESSLEIALFLFDTSFFPKRLITIKDPIKYKKPQYVKDHYISEIKFKCILPTIWGVYRLFKFCDCILIPSHEKKSGNKCIHKTDLSYGEMQYTIKAYI